MKTHASLGTLQGKCQLAALHCGNEDIHAMKSDDGIGYSIKFIFMWLFNAIGRYELNGVLIIYIRCINWQRDIDVLI